MVYRLTIVDDNGVVLDSMFLDGLDLTKPLHQAAVGSLVAAGMGDEHIRRCAEREPEES